MSAIDELAIEQYERFYEIRAMLDKSEASPEGVFWFFEEAETQYDEGFSFCYDCIKVIMPDAKRGEHFTGGGSYESDGCVHCEECSKLLQYTLTDYGVESELGHFVENPPTTDDLANPEICYELARIAWGIFKKEQALKFLALFALDAADVETVKGIGE